MKYDISRTNNFVQSSSGSQSICFDIYKGLLKVNLRSIEYIHSGYLTSKKLTVKLFMEKVTISVTF